MGCGQRDHREKRRSVHRPASRKTLGRRLLASVAGCEKTKAPSYVETLERDWRVHVAPKWGMREVQSITRDEVQMWVSALAESKSASVVLRAEGILRALLAKVKADKCIHDNPCDGLELPRKRRKKRVYLRSTNCLPWPTPRTGEGR